MKTTHTLLLLAIVLCGLILSSNLHPITAQTGTQISGIIGQDTVWTISGSPYTLTGNALVSQGVALSIQPGVTVNLENYYIKVNGTLTAIGNPTEKIRLNEGQITFTNSSNGWNQQTNSGCIIENANINQTSIYSDKPLKIDHSIISRKTNIGGVNLDAISVVSSLILNNIITGTVSGSNSIISNNIINGYITVQVISGIGSFRSESSVISNNIVTGGISVGYFSISGGLSGDKSQVFNNTVNGSIYIVSGEGAPQIYNNTVSSGGIVCAGYGSIFDNYIYGSENGISLSTPRGFGGNLPCYAIVQDNLIVNNSQGVSIQLTSTFGSGINVPTISGNTITGNSIGISLYESNYVSAPTFLNNNLQSNSKYSFYLSAPNNVNATYNWWGTTDIQAINQSIYDFKNDFNLGNVIFIPFLTSPNPQAPNVPEPTPIPTSNPTQSPSQSPSVFPTPSPSIPEFPSSILVTILLVAILAGITLLRKRIRENKLRGE